MADRDIDYSPCMGCPEYFTACRIKDHPECRYWSESAPRHVIQSKEAARARALASEEMIVRFAW